MNAPTKPSTVFLGESLISGVLPKVTPNEGNNNLNNEERATRTTLRTAYVRPDVIADDKRRWHPEPDEALHRQAQQVSIGPPTGSCEKYNSWSRYLENVVDNEVAAQAK